MQHSSTSLVSQEHVFVCLFLALIFLLVSYIISLSKTLKRGIYAIKTLLSTSLVTTCNIIGNNSNDGN